LLFNGEETSQGRGEYEWSLLRFALFTSRAAKLSYNILSQDMEYCNQPAIV